MKNIKLIFSFVFALATLGSLTSCQDDIVDNGISESTALDASFTITPVPGSANRFTLTAKNTSYILSKWNLGDGSPDYVGEMSETIFLPDAGTYEISHIAVGKGGEGVTSTQTIDVLTPDPVSGNIVSGGKLADAADHAKWTLYDVATWSSNATWTFGPGYALLNSFGWDQYGMYQAVNVVAGRKYNIDMIVSSTSGGVDTWFEVYCGTSEPVTGTEYNEGGKLRAISTWDSCGNTPYAGKISAVGCNEENNKGIFTATTTGVVYLVIRGGGNDMKDGIKIQNIEMRGTL